MLPSTDPATHDWLNQEQDACLTERALVTVRSPRLDVFLEDKSRV
jgi:hypothetical protein